MSFYQACIMVLKEPTDAIKITVSSNEDIINWIELAKFKCLVIF